MVRRRAAHWSFQSTLPLRGVTLQVLQRLTLGSISIHTPLAGSDVFVLRDCQTAAISIHTPLAGSDLSIGWSSTAVN